MSKVKNNTRELQAILATINDLPSADTANYEVYDGSYQVTPTVASQTLKTKNKLMQADVVVKEIPYAEVTNLANGKTVTIA